MQWAPCIYGLDQTSLGLPGLICSKQKEKVCGMSHQAVLAALWQQQQQQAAIPHRGIRLDDVLDWAPCVAAAYLSPGA